MPPYAGGHLAIDIGDSYGLPCGGGLSSDDGADDTQRSDGEPTNRTCGGGSGGDGEGRMKPAPPVTLSWPGCGDMIFWQLGVVKGLSRHMDVARMPMLGSSSGAFVAAMSACGVDTSHAANSVLRLLQATDVASRRIGVLGVLGRITRQWLHELLPEDAGARCSRHSHLMVTQLPSLKTQYVSTFASKQEVVDTVLASAHLPLVIDWTWYTMHRNMPVIDGGFWWWLRRSEHEYMPLAVEAAAAAQAAAAAGCGGSGAPSSASSSPASSVGGDEEDTAHDGAMVEVEGGKAGSAKPNVHPEVCIIRPSDDVELLARWHLKRRLRPSNLSGALHLMTLGEAYAERALVERLLAVQHGGSLAAAVAEAEPDAISVASAGVAAAGAAAALASVRLQQQQEAAVTARFAVSTPLSRQVLLIPTSRPRKMAVV